MKEICAMYFPHNTQASAGVQLKRWINYNDKLNQALIEAGYRNGQKLLTPLQVSLIFQYLGEP
ncbi:DUF4248 domain-containing protein [Parabacteroides sp. AM08-6]|nr:DUF4248 domain-containing protein [Parabacteroides sp. AM08-6]